MPSPEGEVAFTTRHPEPRMSEGHELVKDPIAITCALCSQIIDARRIEKANCLNWDYGGKIFPPFHMALGSAKQDAGDEYIFFTGLMTCEAEP